MSHFAKIESGIVTQVIVAEQEYIDTLPGIWIQTSYNTRAGVHYGTDGLPDNLPPLRKNYAGIGYIYDSNEDAFYAPKPSNLHDLDQVSFTWKIKAEYQPMIVVRLISSELVLPDTSAGEVVLIDNTEIRNTTKVFFPMLTVAPGLYTYNQTAGEFEFVNSEDSTIVELGNYSWIYQFNGTTWAESIPV